MAGEVVLIDPQTGLSYKAGGGTGPNAPQSQPVDSTGAPQFGSSGKAPVTGTFTATGQSALFQASVGRAIWVKLTGPFVATVQVERCSDGTSATAQVLTIGGTAYAVFTVPVQEPVSSEDDAGVAYRLNCTAFTSGTVTYSIGHR